MKKKLLLLATAAVFFSPVAAKANSKSSIYVGLTGTLERLMSQGGQTLASDYLKDENFLSGGIEAGYGYKVWSNLQVAGFVRGMYSVEHTYADAKKVGDAVRKDPYAIVIEPRVTLGWEFPVSGTVSITPFIGAGFEMNWAKKDGKEFKMDWKIPAVAGVRANFGCVYASLNARFDLTAAEINAKDEAIGRTEADTARFFGVEASIGAEF
jgi:hypothetical protein